MFEQLIALLTRFVVAVELIATAQTGGSTEKVAVTEKPADVKKTRGKKAAEPEDEEETAPPKKTRGKADPAKTKGPDLKEVRGKIDELAELIASEGEDECVAKFNDLLKEYQVRVAKKVEDDDVENFHDSLRELAEEYWDLE